MVSVAPFTVTIDPRDPLRFHNYAIPDDGAKPGAAAVAALRETFRSHDRLPRLEWIEEAAPLVAAVLATCGMTEELRTQLMVCAPSELVDAPADAEDLSIEPVRESDLLDLERLQRAAFGDAPLLPDEAPRDPRSRGGAVLARAGGVPVSAAAWTPSSSIPATTR